MLSALDIIPMGLGEAGLKPGAPDSFTPLYKSATIPCDTPLSFDFLHNHLDDVIIVMYHHI